MFLLNDEVNRNGFPYLKVIYKQVIKPFFAFSIEVGATYTSEIFAFFAFSIKVCATYTSYIYFFKKKWSKAPDTFLVSALHILG